MSSTFQPSDHRVVVRLSSSNGADAFNVENTELSSLHMNLQAAAGSTETYDTSPPPRFNSLTLDELSQELDRRTKETQRLQEEVENATKVALKRFGISSPPKHSSHKHELNVNGSSGASTVLSAHHQPLVCGLDSLNQGSAHGKVVLENSLDDCLQQMSNLQLNKTCDQHEHETFSFDKAIMNLQTKLQKVQMEKDALTDLRMKDSRTHCDQMEKMLCMLEEIQNIKRSGDQKLQETEDETLALNRRVETLEGNIKELYRTLLSHEKPYGHKSITSPKVAAIQRHWSPAANVSEDLHEETDELQERLVLVCQLEQQLIQAQSQLVNVQREKEQSLQQTEELQSQLNQLKRCGEEQQCELREEVKALRGHLEVAREQLHRAGEEKSCLMALLEQKAQEGRKSQEEELQRRQQEADQHFARLEDAQSQCQILHAEREKLRLKLSEREKMEELLRMQMENSTQMTTQHIRTIDSLQQENSLLSNQLNQHKLDMQQLRAELDQRMSDLAAAEHERRRLHAAAVKEQTLEKQQLSAQLEMQRVQLLTLTKEHKELQQLHSCKNEEHKGVALRLQSQLKNTQAELDQVRSTLRTLEGADGHGLQVAMGMQKEITARREQIDSLRGRIQHLEETMEKLYQEKHYQNLENQRQLQELAFVREEKRQLANELEVLTSKDKQLRERISKMEAILHKMSERFTDCQDFIQLQEQDFFRLKLKHALDLKELQGQNVRTPPVLDSPTPSALTAPPSSRHVSNTHMKSEKQQESPTQELRSLVKDLRRVISENHRPHTVNSSASSSFHRRRSAPERVPRTTSSTDKPEEVKAGSRLRRKTCGSEPHFLKTAELNGKTISNNSFGYLISSPANYTSCLQLYSLGRRSPVHSLLTSDPKS
ncbi:hypothetical protein PAMA_018038 [Pampus argenteus]